MIRIGLFLIVSKFMVSKALSAVKGGGEMVQKLKVEEMIGTQLALTISWLLKVDIRIAKGAASHHVTANTNRQNGTYKNFNFNIHNTKIKFEFKRAFFGELTGCAESFEEHGLGDVWV